MRVATVVACSCSATSAAASSASLIAKTAKGPPLALKLVNAYFLQRSSLKVMTHLRLASSKNYIPELKSCRPSATWDVRYL
jgi:hypothetical protein